MAEGEAELVVMELSGRQARPTPKQPNPGSRAWPSNPTAITRAVAAVTAAAGRSAAVAVADLLLPPPPDKPAKVLGLEAPALAGW